MRATTSITSKRSLRLLYPLVNGRERLSIWEQARGMWKRRRPEPIRELKKMRSEWERPLPSLKR